MPQSDWMLNYDKIEKGKRSYGQESLMTLGNGYLGWRGAPIWSQFSEDHYPGLYVAGVFNRTITKLAGHHVENEDMVNLPNPQLMKFYVDNELISFDEQQIIERESIIDFKIGRQEDTFKVKLPQGVLEISTFKSVDPVNFHCLGFSGKISADFSANIRIESLIDGLILNQNVERYRAFDSREFDVLEKQERLLWIRTRTTAVEIAVAVQTRVNGNLLAVAPVEAKEIVLESGEERLTPDHPIFFEKLIAVATNRETDNPVEVVKNALIGLSWQGLQKSSQNYWKSVWKSSDILVESSDKMLQRMVRMNIFHIRQAAQHHANQYLDASVGSRGLTGEGYRGHIFWDELFVIPYYAANEPETARDLLRYRINRLAAAKENAKVDQEKGAMFPWQSALKGDEQAQFVHLNTVNDEWEADNSRRQRHVSLAIVYDLWIYTQVTGDLSLLKEGGLELLLETTRFWLEKAVLGQDGHYHISGVMGPDEYHEAYPGSSGGITDNAYTNLMLVWQLNWVDALQKIEGLDFSKFDRQLSAKAHEVATKLYLDIAENGVIAQYAGYFDLKEVDFSAYQAKYGDIHRIDRLMKAEGISPDEYQVAKQADMLMIVYNLGAKHTEKLIQQLGYQLPKNWLRVNRDFYLARTVHGSTTSRPVFAGIAVTLGELDGALQFLRTAIGSDYEDIQGGTTAEGIHIGVMGETLEVIQNEFAGISLRNGMFEIAPHLPKSWKRLKFTQVFREGTIKVECEDGSLYLTADQNIQVKVYENSVQLVAGLRTEFIVK